jgi:hypothetical protein
MEKEEEEEQREDIVYWSSCKCGLVWEKMRGKARAWAYERLSGFNLNCSQTVSREMSRLGNMKEVTTDQ